MSYFEANLLKIYCWTALIFIPSFAVIAFMLQSATFDLGRSNEASKETEEFQEKIGQ